MLSPLIRAISSILSRSSTRTKRQGWLLKCEGAIAAASTRRRWCSLLTGSGRKGPLVVLRSLRTSKNSILASQGIRTGPAAEAKKGAWCAEDQDAKLRIIPGGYSTGPLRSSVCLHPGFLDAYRPPYTLV